MKRNEKKDMLIVLNSSTGFSKYPFGNKELTQKVKDLETKGILKYNKLTQRWA